MTDIIVVGGGPAGMTAALYAKRNGMTAMVIEKNGFGGQITHSPKVENFPGTLSMSGNEFADRMLDQILAQKVDIEYENVIAVRDEGQVKVVVTEEGHEFQARAVILANGVKHRMLGIPGEEDLVGDGISFCAVCDGDFYTGKTVCMVGGGNSALQEAILLSEKCKEVIMLQDLPYFTGEPVLQRVLFSRPNVRQMMSARILRFITDDGALRGVEVELYGRVKKTIECDGIFVAIGLIPENDAFKDLVTLDTRGYYDVKEDCTTKTPGIFVAGDCRKKDVRQLTTAVGDGATAAIEAIRYIQLS